MGRPRTYGQPCALCVVRKSRRASGLCDTCDALTEAEGTKKELGIPVEREARRRQREKAALYNRLVAQGMKQGEIAALWEIKVESLRSSIFRWKSSGIAVYSFGNGTEATRTAKPTKQIRPRVIRVHGGGKSGVRGCKCEPCVATRRKSHNDNAQAKREHVAKQLARLAELEAQFGKGKK